jgi:hypothetical protein
MDQFRMVKPAMVRLLWKQKKLLFIFLYFKVCGNSSFTPNIKIVGGIPAIPNSWPAQVLIRITISGVYYIPSNGNFNIKQSFECGGILIDRATVLTAAHCILDTINVQIGSRTYKINVLNPFDPTQYTVYVGLNSIVFLNSSSSPPAPGVKMAVKSVIRVNTKFIVKYYY